MMDWIPVVFVIFKLLVLGIGMFYAVKWHYDRARNGKQVDKRALLRGSAKAAVVFVLALLALALFTYVLVTEFHLNLSA